MFLAIVKYTPIYERSVTAKPDAIRITAISARVAKPELLRYARPGDTIIRVDGAEPNAEWNIFLDMEASGDPELTCRELALNPP